MSLPENSDTPVCPVCRGDGMTVYYGNGPLGQLRSCSQCGTGERLADTIIPAIKQPTEDAA